MKTKIQVLCVVLLALVLAACAASGPAPTAAVTAAPATPTTASTAGFASPGPSYVEVISIDTAWNHYVNHRLGFAMDVPTSMFRDDATCYWHEEGDYSYRPEAGKLPVVVIEGEDRIYITSQYDMVLTRPTQIASGAGYTYKYGGCELRENDVELLANRDYTSYIWEIILRPIATDADLEALIDEVYGECFSLGEISPVEGKDYSRVQVLGDGKPVEESECLLRGGYTFFYSPDLQIAATWLTGQSIHFPSEGLNQGSQDGRMIDSFEFVPRVETP